MEVGAVQIRKLTGISQHLRVTNTFSHFRAIFLSRLSGQDLVLPLFTSGLDALRSFLFKRTTRETKP
jgi:hypothetical protein